VAAPREKSDGFVRGWHPDQRAGVRPRRTAVTCRHPRERVSEIHNSNGDKVMWCELCDDTWWKEAN
jgi:hypothetical protein